jgi:hypothetical protein
VGGPASTLPLSACGLWSSPPTNHFDGADEHGYVEYWEKVANVNFGDGLTLPMEIGFRSHYENGAPSPYLGAGWVIPLLESNFVQTGENSFEMLQPDGWTNLFLRKDATTLNGSAGWMAEIHGDTITAWAQCGWKMVFYKGHILSMTTPKNRTFEYVYSGNVVTAIRENGVTQLGTEMDSTGRLKALTLNSTRVMLALDQKPIVQNIKGQNLIAGMGESLKSITPSEGPSRSFEFAVNEKLQETLKIADSGSNERLFTWDPSTKRIISDNGWKYSLNFPNGPTNFAAISRSSDTTKRNDYWFYDGAHGKEVIGDSDNVQTIRTWFLSGPASGELRKIEEMKNGQLAPVMEADYDEKGRLFRQRLQNGEIDSYTRSPDGTLQSIVRKNGDELLGENRYDVNGRLITAVSDGLLINSDNYRNDNGWDLLISHLSSKVKSLISLDKIARISTRPSISIKAATYIFYDSVGEKMGSLMPDGRVETYIHSEDKLTTMIDGIPKSTIRFFADGKPKERLFYAADGKTVDQTQADEYPSANIQRTRIFNGKGQLVKEISVRTDSSNRIIEYTSNGISQKYSYDNRGNRTSVRL